MIFINKKNRNWETDRKDKTKNFKENVSIELWGKTKKRPLQDVGVDKTVIPKIFIYLSLTMSVTVTKNKYLKYFLISKSSTT